MWYNGYIGIPYKELGRDDSGVDCYGICMKVYREQLGCYLPDFYGQGFKNNLPDEVKKKHCQGVSDLILGEAPKINELKEVSVCDIKEFDLILFKICGYVTHIAVAIDDKRMLHSYNGMDCVIENIYPKWVGRAYKVYRYDSKS